MQMGKYLYTICKKYKLNIDLHWFQHRNTLHVSDDKGYKFMISRVLLYLSIIFRKHLQVPFCQSYFTY